MSEYRCEICRDGELYPMYGVGPHSHDMSKTGSYIGSIVIEPKSEWPPNFHEDPEAPGCGTWCCPNCDGYGHWDGEGEPINTFGNDDQADTLQSLLDQS